MVVLRHTQAMLHKIDSGIKSAPHGKQVAKHGTKSKHLGKLYLTAVKKQGPARSCSGPHPENHNHVKKHNLFAEAVGKYIKDHLGTRL